jgi:hypothetical protein
MSKTNKKTKEQKLSYEWQQVSEYFDFFGREGTAEDLWNMLKLALCNDGETTGTQRSNMIFLYEHIKELAENVWLLLQKQKAKTQKAAPGP